MIKECTELEKSSLLDKGECPDCSCCFFHHGPEGGLTTNIKCANCGSEFNWCPKCAVLSSGLVQRIISDEVVNVSK